MPKVSRSDVKVQIKGGENSENARKPQAEVGGGSSRAPLKNISNKLPAPEAAGGEKSGGAVNNTAVTGRKVCVAEVVVWKGKVNNLVAPQAPRKSESSGQLFVVSYPDVEVPLCQRTRDLPNYNNNKAILKPKAPSRRGERSSGRRQQSGHRKPPRSAKAPKSFQFISAEQHQQLLHEYIRNSARFPNRPNPDFRVDSLFKQEQGGRQQHSATDSKKELSRVDDGSCHSHIDDSGSSQHCFTVETSTDSCHVDDVARYELVESSEFSSVDMEAFAALGSITALRHCRPPKNPRMQTQRRTGKIAAAAAVAAAAATGADSDRSIDENGVGKVIQIDVDETGKPRCTYTELIEKALTEAGDLTVSEIYQWISNHYPFFRPEDDRWKNSVRHNLSINPYFKKGEKSRGGAGHLWTISEESRGMRPNYRRKSTDNLFEVDLCMPMESETDRAVASILGQYNIARATQMQQEQQNGGNSAAAALIAKDLLASGEQLPLVNNPSEDVIIGFETLPPGTYTLELNGLSLQRESLNYDAETMSQTGYVIVGQDDSNKENLESISNIMNDMATLSNFPFSDESSINGSLIPAHLDFENIGLDEVCQDGSKKTATPRSNSITNTRNEFFTMPAPPTCEEVMEEKPMTPDSSHELLLLEVMGESSQVCLEEVMDVTCSGEDHIPLLSEQLFDAKELGLICCNYDMPQVEHQEC